jgi:hypothetical protein
MRAQQPLFFLFFFIVWSAPAVARAFHGGVVNTMRLLGFDDLAIAFCAESFNRVLFGGQ